MSHEEGFSSVSAVNTMDERTEARQPYTPIERWFWEGWLQRKAEIADEIFSPDIVVHASIGDVRGIEVLKEGAREIHGLDELSGHAEIVHQGAESAGVFLVRGRHVRSYFGLEPTGERMEIHGVVTVRSSEGKVAEIWQTCTVRFLDPEEEEEPLDSFTETKATTWARGWALSPREAIVADLAMRGYSDKQIGDELRLATTSINKYMQHVLRKAGVRSRAELAERAGVVRVG